MKAYVYILKDENNKFYIGSTSNLIRRIKQHDHGYTQTTNRMENPVLVFSQEYANLKTARWIEQRLKKLKRKDYVEKIISDGYIKMSPSWYNG
ncbi:GIY-YIG nuclease family protein [Patescibacteria group bacterium]|nr:GIY-YIG nuclease family protein [Patescibacteria group bacterium]MBU4458865.1 GIY-YIG nuclease family protein [Patescibacteria group bacterium]MCG2696150.1 GIY-YIG nuclease family protein [Candidatus Portnoybacteria bacterium]MCG2762398.1 GIY-YIG nuclease family protein [Candidatus Atribacteria bacterium]